MPGVDPEWVSGLGHGTDSDDVVRPLSAYDQSSNQYFAGTPIVMDPACGALEPELPRFGGHLTIMPALSMAVGRRRPEEVLHHCDQGSQHTSLAFGKRCREMGGRPSTGPAGECHDNAMAESFFAPLECGLVARRSFHTRGEAKRALFDVRLHRRLVRPAPSPLLAGSGQVRFANNPHVPFTNNRAERDSRVSKVKQKVSGCFRNRRYAAAYCRASGYLQSMADPGYNPLVAIQIALAGDAVKNWGG